MLLVTIKNKSKSNYSPRADAAFNPFRIFLKILNHQNQFTIFKKDTEITVFKSMTIENVE